MSETGPDVFHRILQTTNTWLVELMEVVGPDRQVAWKVLSTVLRRLRDRLPIDLAARLGADLPLLVRGAYYDQFRPATELRGRNTLEAFFAEVGEWLRDIRPIDPPLATQAVFALLSRRMPETLIAEVQDALPRALRDFWTDAAETLTGDARHAGSISVDREARL